MSKYQLEYFNSYDVSKATSSRVIALGGNLPPHSYFMVSDGITTVCYQTVIFAASLGFSSTAGLVELYSVTQSSPGGTIGTAVQDYVGWSKTTATGAQTLPTSTAAFLARAPLDANNNPVVSASGTGTWQIEQPDNANACTIVVASTGKVVTQSAPLLSANQPPVSNKTEADTVVTTTQNVGLMKPLITELLPNPLGTGNDATDEYIELYNPNTANFDLTGYTLLSGTTTLHRYTFGSGSLLAPQSFTAFYATTTKLSLSNSGGQVSLANPAGEIIDASAVYGPAVDGRTWAYGNTTWQWTTTATPAALNVITTPAAKTSTKQSKTSSTKASAKTSSTKANSSSTVLAAHTTAVETSNTPIHVWMLALVALLAVLYGAYEFRTDIGNRFQQFRGYIAYRKLRRVQAKGR